MGTNNWKNIFWNNLPSYIQIISANLTEVEKISVAESLTKLSFVLPRGLISKHINKQGMYQVISQSKEYSVGFSDEKELLITKDLPLIIFGDHSKTIKFVNHEFILGADGVKILKPNKEFNEKYFYYSLFGAITDTKNYGRHFSLLRKGYILKPSLDIQLKIVCFLEDLLENTLDSGIYFDKKSEDEILAFQNKSIQISTVETQLTTQQSLIKKLKQAYLSEAIRGELVEQDPSDELASELLARIKSKKLKTQTKKVKPLKPITNDEIPFDIPESWTWCRLGEICDIFMGQSPEGHTYNKSGNGMPFYQGKTEFGRIYPKNINTWCSEPKKISEVNDILISVRAPAGDVNIADKEYAIGRGLGLIRIDNSTINLFYLFHFLDIEKRKWVVTGSFFDAINRDKIEDKLFPLPPLAEQERIVERLDELMALCDRLESENLRSQAQTKELLAVVLKESLEG